MSRMSGRPVILVCVVVVSSLLGVTAQNNASFAMKRTSTKTYATAGLTADLNGDGIPDLVANLGHNIVVQFGTGTGAFSAPTTVFAPNADQGVETLAVGDFDGDANLDIAVGVYNAPCDEGGCASDDVHILYCSGA